MSNNLRSLGCVLTQHLISCEHMCFACVYGFCNLKICHLRLKGKTEIVFSFILSRNSISECFTIHIMAIRMANWIYGYLV